MTCLSDVLELLEFDDTGAIIVSCDGKSVDGIISQRDIVRGLRYYGQDVLNVEVACLMAIGVVTCSIDESVAGVLSIMRSHQVQYLPILDKGEIAGLVSLRDIAAPAHYQT
ncbi:MAG: CBS domain-containing protein [Rhizobiales bacterium]|nr:CBS domain-containing protein [Hyphomicrobiales bacterium]